MIEKKISVSEAIIAINPSAKVSVTGHPDGTTDIVWIDTAEISKADIDAKVVSMQAEYDAQEYARNRRTEYDALNQFELISDDTINGTTTHKDAIEAIKAKYPKP